MPLVRNKSVQTLVGGVLWGPKQDAWLHNEPHGCSWVLGVGQVLTTKMPPLPVMLRRWQAREHYFLWRRQTRDKKNGDKLETRKDTCPQGQTVMESYRIQGTRWHHRFKNNWCFHTFSHRQSLSPTSLGLCHLPASSLEELEDNDSTTLEASEVNQMEQASGEMIKEKCHLQKWR